MRILGAVALLVAFFAGWQKAKFDHPVGHTISGEMWDFTDADTSTVSPHDIVDVQIQSDAQWITVAFGAFFETEGVLRIQEVDRRMPEAFADRPIRLRPTVYPGYTPLCGDCQKMEHHDNLIHIGKFFILGKVVMERYECLQYRAGLVHADELGWVIAPQALGFRERG